MAGRVTKTFEERLWAKVTRPSEDGCWEFSGGRHSAGYGVIWKDGRLEYTHRATYELFVGPIPRGFEIDHLCKNVACCNPAHLEAVEPAVNNMRSDSWAAVNARKVVCIRGHEFTYRKRGGSLVRHCAVCENALRKERRRKV